MKSSEPIVQGTQIWYKTYSRPIKFKEVSMPIFEYNCNHCKKEFERLVFAGEEGNVLCPECTSADITKKMSATSFMGASIGTCASDAPRQFS